MLRRRLCALVLASLWIQPIIADDSSGATTVAITANSQPILELHRANGSIRYQIDEDWLLGLGLGISPIDLARNRYRIRGLRWLPHFELFESRYLRAQENRVGARWFGKTVQWYWTFGPDSSFETDYLERSDRLDFRSDLLHHYSLQTKAGFIVPFGKHWLFGGAVTFDRVIQGGSHNLGQSDNNRDASAAAYLGIKRSY